MSATLGETELVPVDSILPDPHNPRRHPDRNLEAIKASLARFGQVPPLVVNRPSRVIVAGNGTWLMARALGWTEIAVRWVDLPEEEARALAIALNRTGELAEWDDAVLASALEAIRADAALFSATGFDDADLQARLAAIAGTDVTAPGAFPSLDETLPTDYRCPRCAYEWSGKPKQ